MSERTEKKVVSGLNIFLTVATIVGLASSVVVIPYRVTAGEKRTEQLESRIGTLDTLRAADHELLVRIEERLKDLQRQLGDRKNENQNRKNSIYE